jgi:hypothetical protein
MDDQALRDYFKFDEADLFANRNGRFSDKQQKALVKEERKQKKLGIGCGIFALVIAFILIIIIFVRGAIGSSIPAVIGAVICVGVGGYLLYAQFFMPYSVKHVLKKVEGPTRIVSVRKKYDNNKGYYYLDELHCGKENFDIDEKHKHLMVQGDIYAVYFMVDLNQEDDEDTGIPWIKKILSVEWLSKGSATHSDASEENNQD